MADRLTMLSKLIKMRDSCRKIYGEKWAEERKSWEPIIRAAMIKHNCNDLQAAIILCNQIPEEAYSIMAILGTVMEMQDE